MQTSLPQLNHYEILGLPRNATRVEIREAYLKLVKIYHPDLAKPARRKAFLQIFQLITGAYATLGKPDSKRVYDAALPPEDAGTTANDNMDTFWERLFK